MKSSLMLVSSESGRTESTSQAIFRLSSKVRILVVALAEELLFEVVAELEILQVDPRQTRLPHDFRREARGVRRISRSAFVELVADLELVRSSLARLDYLSECGRPSAC